MRKIESARRDKKIYDQDKKYSNTTLFKKRELRGFSSRPKTTKTLSIYTDYQKNFPTLTQTTLPTSFRNESKTTKYNPIITHSNFSEIISNDSFYLTETKKIIVPTISNISKINNISNFSFRKDNKNENPDTLFLKIIEKKLKTNNNIDLNSNLLEEKRERIKKKNGIQDYINKTRENILLNYTTKMKKERSIRLNEEYNNKIAAIDSKIKSLIESYNLFNSQFLSKFSDYVKILEIKKAIEKIKNEELNGIILKLKLEISQIENKIRAMEYDKSTFYKWLYFQIGVKENKLKLPIYYKYILEESESNFQKNISTYKAHKRLTKGNLRKKPIEKKSQRLSFFSDNFLTSENHFNTYKFLSKKEILRIRDYLYKPVFESTEEFNERFIKLKKDIINNLDLYTKIKDELFELKKEKNDFKNQKLKELESTDNYIFEKQKELEFEKKKKYLLKREIHDLKHMIKNILNKKKNKKDKNKKQRTSLLEVPKYIKRPKPKLTNSLEMVYQTCLQNKIDDFDININKKKINKNYKIHEMIEKLNKIELYTDHLISKIKYLKQNVTIDNYKKIQSNIDKMHIKEKAKIQREELEEKFKQLKEKVEERNNKFYFLTKRPINTYFEYCKKNRAKTASIKKNYTTEPTLNDYIFDDSYVEESSSDSESENIENNNF